MINKIILENLNIILDQNKFEPYFYWTGDLTTDAKNINWPHMIAEGVNEDRIKDTYDLISMYKEDPNFDGIIDIKDVFNIQNYFLKNNNWKCIERGLRKHNVMFNNTPDWKNLSELFYSLLPVSLTKKEDLLLWYTVMQKIHPLSDLNGRTFGVIVAILYVPEN